MGLHLRVADDMFATAPNDRLQVPADGLGGILPARGAFGRRT